jgi:uncharacterized RDD family membrane protein YckC
MAPLKRIILQKELCYNGRAEVKTPLSRILAFLIDIFLYGAIEFAASLEIAPRTGHPRVVFLGLVSCFFLYEWRFRNSPGKQILGLETRFADPGVRYQLVRFLLRYFAGIISVLYVPFNRKRQLLHDRLAGSRVEKESCRLRWLRGTAGLFFAFNLFVVAALQEAIRSRFQGLDRDRLDRIPERRTMGHVPDSDASIRQRLDDFEWRVPLVYRGMQLESFPLGNAYALTGTAGKEDPSIAVMKSFDWYSACSGRRIFRLLFIGPFTVTP